MPMAISGQMHLVEPKAGKTDAIPAVSDGDAASDPAPNFGATLAAALQPGADQAASAVAVRTKLPPGQGASAAGPNSPLVQKDAANIVPITILPSGNSLPTVPPRGASGVAPSGAVATAAPRARKTADNPVTVPAELTAATLPAAAPAEPSPAAVAAEPAATPGQPAASQPVPLQPVAAQPAAVQLAPGQTAPAGAVTPQPLPDPAVTAATATAAAAVNPAAPAANPQPAPAAAQQAAQQAPQQAGPTSVPAGRGGATLTLAGVKPAAPVQARVTGPTAPAAPSAQAEADPAPSDAPLAAPVAGSPAAPTPPSVAQTIATEDLNPALPSPPTHPPGQGSGNESATVATPAQPTVQPETLLAAITTPAGATSAARPLSSSAPPPSVAQQVTPAVISLAQGGLQSGNSRTVSVSITPDELGQVSITVEKAADGTTNIHVTAERLATLDLLRNDQADLSHALNEAGVQQSSSSLSFSWDGPPSGGGAQAGQNWANQGWSGQDPPPGQQRSALASYADDRSASLGATAAARGGIDLTA